MTRDDPLARAIHRFTTLLDRTPDDEPAILAQGRGILGDLVAQDDWLPDACAQPHPAHYQQYLLHLDPAARFAIVSFVWGPGQRTPVHDHTVWALIGMLRGAELGERYTLDPAGGPMRPGGAHMLHPGEVDHVSPRLGDIHQVANGLADRVSISIHVYGGNIGALERHTYDPATGRTKTFVSGYANAAGGTQG